MAAASSGRAFIESGKLRDENGQPLPLAHRRAAAALVGVSAGALGMLGVRSNAAEIAAPILRDATMEAMKNPGFRDALTKGATELARGGTTGAAMMGTLTAIQEGVLDAAKGLSDGDWKTIANDPKRRQEVVSAINKSMLEGAILVGGMHAPAVGYNFVADAARIRQSQADLKSLDNLIGAAAETNTATRSPEALAAFVRHSVGEQVIGFPAETINRFLAAKPGSLDFIPDLAKQLEQSNATGSDVVAPLADFLAHNPEMLKELREDVRLRPDSLTAKEATALEESPPDYAAIAYHGSPHVFDAFDISKIGTGEGAQSYGHGLYFAEAPGVAKSYADMLSDRLPSSVDGKPFDNSNVMHRASNWANTYSGDRVKAADRVREELKIENLKDLREDLAYLESDKPLGKYEEQPSGALYQVRLKLDPERTILYDRPLSEQPPAVLDALAKASDKVLSGEMSTPETVAAQRRLLSETYLGEKATSAGEWLARNEKEVFGSHEKASEAFREAGIQGIKYLDQDSRAALPHLEFSIKSSERG
jgi:hypothetical protein